MELLRTRGVKFLTVLLMSLLIPAFISAETEDKTADKDGLYEMDMSLKIDAAYYLQDHLGYEVANGGFAPIDYTTITAPDATTQRDLGGFGAEAKVNYKVELKRDFLTGDSAMTQGNSLKHSFGVDITPVDVSLSINNVISPIAFLEFSLGSSLATGWKAIGVDGLALLNDDGVADDSAFQGVLSKSWLGGTFQFDLAAILGGDTTWKHVVLMSYHSLNYQYFSGATATEAWVYQGGSASYNGFKYSQSSLIGYQMPLVLDMVGILLETGNNLFEYADISTIAEDGWGSDYVDFKLGALFSFDLGEHSSLILLPQIKRNLKYTDETLQQKNFADRVATTGTYWDFERIALSYTYKF